MFTESRTSIYYILILALLVRFLFAGLAYYASGDLGVFLSLDSHSYIRGAQNLLSNGSLSFGKGPETVMTPGYPILLILGLSVGYVQVVTVSLQILSSCLTVYLIFLLSRNIFNDNRASLIGAIFYSFEPLAIFYAAKLLTETFFTTIFVGFTYFFINYLKKNSIVSLIASGILLVVAIYIRPAAYFVPLVLLFFLIGRAFVIKIPLGVVCRHSLIFIVLCGVCLGGWHLRNYFTTGYYGFSQVYGRGLYCWPVAQILAFQKGGTLEQWQKRLGCVSDVDYITVHPEQRDWSATQVLSWQEREARQFIRDNLPSYAYLHVLGVAKTIAGPGFDNYYRIFAPDAQPRGAPENVSDLNTRDVGFNSKIGTLFSRPLAIVMLELSFMLLLVFTYMSAVWGSISALKTKPQETLFLLFLIMYFLAITGTIGYSRYRTPAMPLICVLSGYGLAQILDRLKPHFLAFRRKLSAS